MTGKKALVGKSLLTLFFGAVSALWVLPIVIVLYNSFKSNDAIKTSLFSLPTAENFVGFENYSNGIMQGNYPFYYAILFSFIITVLSVGLILLCTSMAAWYINRVDSTFCRLI